MSHEVHTYHYRIIKHLYQAFVSHQTQNGVQNHLGMRRYPSFSGCANFYESRREFFEIMKIAHLEGFEKFVILSWREDFLKVSKWSTIFFVL